MNQKEIQLLQDTTRPPAMPQTTIDPLAFLVGHQIDQDTLEQAHRIAHEVNMPPHVVLLNHGWVTPEDYTRSLATQLNVACILDGPITDTKLHLIDTTDAPPEIIAHELDQLVNQHNIALNDIALTTALRPHSTLTAPQWHAALDHAIHGLSRKLPQQSAHARTWLWQKIAATLALGSGLGMALIDMDVAYFVITFIAAVPFLFIVAQRLASLLTAIFLSFITPPPQTHSKTWGVPPQIMRPATTQTCQFTPS